MLCFFVFENVNEMFHFSLKCSLNIMTQKKMKKRWKRYVFKSIKLCRESDNELSFFQIVHPKSDLQRQRLSEAIKNILLFRSLEPVRY